MDEGQSAKMAVARLSSTSEDSAAWGMTARCCAESGPGAVLVGRAELPAQSRRLPLEAGEWSPGSPNGWRAADSNFSRLKINFLFELK